MERLENKENKEQKYGVFFKLSQKLENLDKKIKQLEENLKTLESGETAVKPAVSDELEASLSQNSSTINKSEDINIDSEIRAIRNQMREIDRDIEKNIDSLKESGQFGFFKSKSRSALRATAAALKESLAELRPPKEADESDVKIKPK